MCIRDSPYTLQIIKTADLDGDGDLDIISAASNPSPTSDNHRIIWYENDGANNPTWSINTITSGDINERYFAMNISDLDHDGDLDIIFAKLNDIRLLENDGSNDPAFSESSIAGGAGYVEDIEFGDIDNDGDLDIIYASMLYICLLYTSPSPRDFG